jgi:hypothetical protein
VSDISNDREGTADFCDVNKGLKQAVGWLKDLLQKKGREQVKEELKFGMFIFAVFCQKHLSSKRVRNLNFESAISKLTQISKKKVRKFEQKFETCIQLLKTRQKQIKTSQLF